MNYLSAKEVAHLWGISPRRVGILAATGRLEGARIIGKSWMIPEDTKKPGDARKKEYQIINQNPDPYFFPYIMATVHSKAQMDVEFSDEQRALYHCFVTYETGDFAGCVTETEQLLENAGNTYTRMGCLYLLSMAYIYSRQFDKAGKTISEFRLAVAREENHAAEMEMLLRDFNSAFESGLWLVDSFAVNPAEHYTTEVMPYIATLSCYKDLLKMGKGRSTENFSTHELHCIAMERDGYFCMAIQMHYYLAVLNIKSNHEYERYHMERAVSIAVKNNTYATLASLMSYNPDAMDEVLMGYPDEIVTKITRIARDTRKALGEFLSYYGKTTFFSKLTGQDYRYISYCTKYYPIKKMAEIDGVSESTVKKHMLALYAKLGVRSKNELTDLFVDSVLDRTSVKGK